MRRRMLLHLVAAALAAGFAPPPPRSARVAGDLKEMQGTWVPARAGTGDYRWVIAADKLKVVTRGEVTHPTITLDTTKSPRQGVLKGAGWVCRGIYSLEGDCLKFCTDGDNAEPPGGFDGPKRGKIPFVFTRER